MTGVVVGMDAGGSKLAVRVEDLDGHLIAATTLPAASWDAEPTPAAAAWIAARLERTVPHGHAVTALGLGAQGCDSPEVCASLTAELASLGIRATVVNDAALLLPAAGLEAGIGVIAGTGAIAVGVDAAGEPLAAGGWGWVIGDDAGGAGIVREAAKSALAAADAGEPDDGLLAALCGAFGVATAERLARAVNDEPTAAHWAPRAPAVFAAAEAGSARASRVIEDAAEHLTILVSRLVQRGAVGRSVVAAGGVLVGQPRLYRSFVDQLSRQHPDLQTYLLADPPVLGAVELARRLVAEGCVAGRDVDRSEPR